MSYVRLEDTFAGCPKWRRLGRRLAVSRVQVAGHLALLWSWALSNAKDGDLTSFDDEDLEGAMHWDGEPGALIAAMVAERLIDRMPDPHGGGGGGERLVIHDWMDYAGSWHEAQRSQKHREIKLKQAAASRDGHVTVTSPSRDRHVPLIRPDQTGAERSTDTCRGDRGDGERVLFAVPTDRPLRIEDLLGAPAAEPLPQPEPPPPPPPLPAPDTATEIPRKKKPDKEQYSLEMEEESPRMRAYIDAWNDGGKGAKSVRQAAATSEERDKLLARATKRYADPEQWRLLAKSFGKWSTRDAWKADLPWALGVFKRDPLKFEGWMTAAEELRSKQAARIAPPPSPAPATVQALPSAEDQRRAQIRRDVTIDRAARLITLAETGEEMERRYAMTDAQIRAHRDALAAEKATRKAG